MTGSIEQIGQHRVKHGNIMDGIDDLMNGVKADFIYSDPPWGQGNLSYWQTMNEKMTGAEKVHVDFLEFMDLYFKTVAKYSKGVMIIEYGIRWREDIERAVKKVGLRHCDVTRSVYSGGGKLLPLDMHLISHGQDVKMSDNYKEQAAVTKGQKVVDLAFNEFYRGGVVLDPMCGMGYTAQATVDRGGVFYGNELNEARLEKTKNRLRKASA